MRNFFLTSIVLALGAVPASANLIIAPTFDATITGDPNSAAIIATINSVISVYQNTFLDPITVAISFAGMSTGLGQNVSYYGTVSYAAYRAKLVTDATSATDATVLANLPTGTLNPVTSTLNINAKTANLRALGFTGIATLPAPGSPDGAVSVNLAITDVGTYGGSYSLFAVLEHEIDEVLGLGSGLDYSLGIFSEDLFRYSAPSVRSYSTSASASYLSFDDGTTQIVGLNQNGGADYGDWVSSATVRVQDAFGTPGSHPTLGSAELSALDAIGYNLAPVPEPATWAMMIAGLLAAFGYRKRKLARARV